ncbi:transporter substrate-binding domain-containing protein [Thalassomonas viridans]|uniref:Transporter substrate-binding domain-containing protein n=1 Tax=Thalassomonas viridans TaxID=137584 RepID=A0AAE9Z1Z5_9GAMM|nr:transporter substrate-binding domain-containing protein [Thalassomonas viridans]WDE05321.1 transporter substrate-binding domain-containing protein [Thalassomonas viridans]
MAQKMFLKRLTLMFFPALLWLHSLTAWGIGPDRLLLSTQEWPPYQTYSEDQISGLAISRVKCVLRQMEQPYQLTMTNWAKAQLNVQNGVQHGFFITEKTPERDRYAVFSEPMISHHWYWYYSNALTDTSISDINKLKWKVSAKFGSQKWFYLHNNGYDVVKKPRNMKNLLDMLLHNEVDAVLVDELAMQVELKRIGMTANSFRNRRVATKPMGVYFNKQFVSRYPGFLEEFNQAVGSCSEQ